MPFVADAPHLTTVLILNDCREHACPCGSFGYAAWDGDGWLPQLVVTGDEGRTVEECESCGRLLQAVPTVAQRVARAIRNL